MPSNGCLIGDMGYDALELRQQLAFRGTASVIPSHPTRKHPWSIDLEVYKERNLVERMFGRLKDFRRIATRVWSLAAKSADDLKLPANFRNWYHVNTMVIDKGSPLFEAMGGMHNVYINSTGETALKKGEPYPDKTALLVDLHEFTVSDSSYT